MFTDTHVLVGERKVDNTKKQGRVGVVINSDVLKFDNGLLQWSERKVLFYEHVHNHKFCISPHYSNLQQVGQNVH